MKVSTSSSGQLATIGLCITEHGPYTFVVDTGSARSIIDTSVASSLDLGSTGSESKAPIGGSGCATSGTLVHVPSMHTGDVVLAPQDMVESSLSDWAGKKIDGVLGSDALGRFTGIKLDLTRQQLSFEGSQGPAPISHVLFVGSPNAAVSPALLAGATPAVNVPMTIVKAPGSIVPFANVTVASHGPYSFVVNTGSPSSSINKTVAFTDHLTGDGVAPTQAGVGCAGSVPVLTPTSVELATSARQTLRLRSVKIEGSERPGIVGTLGLDYLGTYGAIVLDYTSAALALTTG